MYERMLKVDNFLSLTIGWLWFTKMAGHLNADILFLAILLNSVLYLYGYPHSTRTRQVM